MELHAEMLRKHKTAVVSFKRESQRREIHLVGRRRCKLDPGLKAPRLEKASGFNKS